MRVTGLGRNRSEAHRKLCLFRLLPVLLGQNFFFFFLGCRIVKDLPVWLVNTGSHHCMVVFGLVENSAADSDRQTCRHTVAQHMFLCNCAQPSSAGKSWPTDQSRSKSLYLIP